MSGRTVDIQKIEVVDRHRQDLGDLTDLAKSIEQMGLLHPVVITPDYRLVAGERRLSACKQLGHSVIEATVVTCLADASDLLIAERDENTCRKDFTASEAVALGRQLEALERPAAQERKAATVANLRNVGAGQVPPPTESSPGRVREKVGTAVGLSGRTYQRAREVVEAQEHPDPEVAATAKEATAEMDTTGNVAGAARKVAQAKVKAGDPTKTREAVRERIARVREMADAGHTSRQIAETLELSESRVKAIAADLGIVVHADRIVGKSRRHDPNRIVSEMVSTLEALAMSVDLVALEDIDRTQLEGWATSLNDSLKTLNRFHKQLKEMTQ